MAKKTIEQQKREVKQLKQIQERKKLEAEVRRLKTARLRKTVSIGSKKTSKFLERVVSAFEEDEEPIRRSRPKRRNNNSRNMVFVV